MLKYIIMNRIKKILNWIHHVRGYPTNDKKVIFIIKQQLERFGKSNVEVRPSDITICIAEHFDEARITFSFYHDHLYYLVYLDGEKRVISEPTAEKLLMPCNINYAKINYLRIDFNKVLKIKYKNGHFNARICKIKQD